MAGRVRHLVNRSGRYHARIVVPKDLRNLIGKTELRHPLGGDYRQALRLLPGAVAQMQHEIALAERKLAESRPGGRPIRFPLSPEQIAWANYQSRLSFDDELRNDQRYAGVNVDDLLVRALRDGMAGRLSDDELHRLVGERIERYRHLGNTDVAPATDAWRTLARMLCASEYEALSRVAERDEGDFTGSPTHPALVNGKPDEVPEKRVSLSKLWDDYVKTRTLAGFMKAGAQRQAPVIKSLRAYLKHDDARRVTKKDVIGWRDHLMTTHSAKTVSDVYLSTLRSLFRWAIENEHLSDSPAATVRQAKPRKIRSRERGFTDEEAAAVLIASRSYAPKSDEFGRVREKDHLIAAKQWAPILCAFSGARISEITQLRKEDIRQEDDRWVIRIAPEAGTVKTGEYRDVPLHRQIVELGFINFVREAASGPLFHGGTDPEQYSTKAMRISNQVAGWLRKSGAIPDSIEQPNHAWRHRLKTKARELGINHRVIDAIQGHAARSAADGYGDVTLLAKANAIDLFPSYKLTS